ncbi:MAG: ribosome rescue GTPase HflX [Gammaproteobacteria bacterium]
MFERPKSGERAILVHLDFKRHFETSDPMEFQELARSAGAEVISFIQGTREAPDPKYFVGEGKLEEIFQTAQAEKVELVIFDHALSPAQERNLEKKLNCRVVDRTGLILDIFAQRARTFEGKLQVELAQLQHLSTRLVRGWTHLERQKGGIGLRGPGETQLESDRRMLRERIKTIEKRLENVRMQRSQGRRARQRNAIPTVVLVGYTNVGKSTLFNVLAQADAYVANKLFATLDPTLRVIHPPGFRDVILADTVGFVSNLPHSLVEAFKATLEEVKEASLLLHVVDAHQPEYVDNMRSVNEVLQEIEASEVPQLVVMNKVDLVHDSPHSVGTIERNAEGKITRVWVSALSESGLDALQKALSEALTDERIDGQIDLMPQEGQIRAKFHQLAAIYHEAVLENGGWTIQFKLPKSEWVRLCRQWPILVKKLQTN